MRALNGFIITLVVMVCVIAGPGLYRSMFLGSPVEQNELALVLRAIGERSAETVNQNQFDSELITATRGPGPLEVGVVQLTFPLGLQAYEFSARQSFDSESSEPVICDSRGGPVEFDVVVHMHIDETLPDIEQRLLNFTAAYQLRQYDGSTDVLVDLVRTRFRDIIREPFVNWCASRQVLTIMNNKSEINELALAHMNDEFNQYGLRFTLVSVTSAMRISQTQQDRLNNLVTQSTDTAARDLRNEQLLPLQQDVGGIENDGDNAAQAALDAAELTAARTRATAEAAQRTALIELLGADAFMFMQTTVAPLDAMADSDAGITIVPNDARIYLGEARTED